MSRPLIKYNVATVKEDAQKYAIAQTFIRNLRGYHKLLTPQQMRTLRGQALSGNLEGAEKGLRIILGRP